MGDEAQVSHRDVYQLRLKELDGAPQLKNLDFADLTQQALILTPKDQFVQKNMSRNNLNEF